MASVVAKVLPSVAVVFSNVQLTSPLRVVLMCRKHNNLGSLNPVPWAVSFINCLGYMMYGCLTKNPYVMASVTLGLPINYFATSSAISILGKGREPTHNRLSWKIDIIVLLGLGLWIAVAFVIGAILPKVMPEDVNEVALTIVGYVTITTCMLYYAAPLSVLMEIIKNKDAAGLYTPMIVMNFLTSALWAAYGFAFIGDPVVYAPNMFAMLLSAAQITLKFIYPSVDPTKLQRRMSKEYEADEETETTEGFTTPSPPGGRPRSTSCTQDILCADGTVGVLEFSPEEVQERNQRSSSVTSIAEVILDTIDIMGPRRHPADVVEVRHGESDGSLSSLRSARGSSFHSPSAAAALARSPVRRMTINTQLGSPSHGHGPSSSGSNRARHRSMSDVPLPVIDEEAGLEGLDQVTLEGPPVRPFKPARPQPAAPEDRFSPTRRPAGSSRTTAPLQLQPGAEYRHAATFALPPTGSPLHARVSTTGNGGGGNGGAGSGNGNSLGGRSRSSTRDSQHDAADEEGKK